MKVGEWVMERGISYMIEGRGESCECVRMGRKVMDEKDKVGGVKW